MEEYIEGDGINLFVRHSGPKNAEPIVLLHGYPQTSAMWHAVAPILSRSYQVICPDLRGYGASEKPNSDARSLSLLKASYGKGYNRHDETFGAQ